MLKINNADKTDHSFKYERYAKSFKRRVEELNSKVVFGYICT